jgi:V8-like Glu-specific endopeptidase
MWYKSLSGVSDGRFVMALRAIIMSAAALGAITAVAVPAAGAASAGGSGAAARTAGCLRVRTLTFSSTQDAAALRYWTPARMKAVRGFDQVPLSKLGHFRRPPAGAGPVPAVHCVNGAGLSQAAPGTAPLAAPSTTASSGYPTIGKLTFSADGVLSLNCTATVINGTPARNNNELIVTAAHCIEGATNGFPYTSTHIVFSPMWHNNQNPFGTWTVRKIFLDSGWMKCVIPLVACSTNPLYDYAVIVLNPSKGKGVGAVTGSDGWHVNQPNIVKNVAIAGIPATSSDTLISLAHTATVTEGGHPYRKATTPGLTDGSSGGPWLQNFSIRTGRGVLLGDTGGYQQGGPSSGSPSYADYWTSKFSALVKAAVSYEG